MGNGDLGPGLTQPGPAASPLWGSGRATPPSRVHGEELGRTDSDLKMSPRPRQGQLLWQVLPLSPSGPVLGSQVFLCAFSAICIGFPLSAGGVLFYLLLSWQMILVFCSQDFVLHIGKTSAMIGKS